MSGGGHANIVTDLYAPLCDGAAKSSKVRVGPVDPLNRENESVVQRGCDDNGFQVAHQCRAAVPGSSGRALGNVVAVECGERNGADGLKPQGLGKLLERLRDTGEDVRIKAHQVHFINRQRHMPDTHERHQVGVPPGLRQQALLGIDQQHSDIGR